VARYGVRSKEIPLRPILDGSILPGGNMSKPVQQRDESEPSRRPFQFGLGTMLIAVAACGVLIAIMQQVGPVWSLAIGWFLMLAAAHVTANAYGTRARRAARQSSSGNASTENPPPSAEAEDRPVASATDKQLTFAPATRLRQSARLGRPMLALTGVGAIVGSSGGVTLLALVNWERIGVSGIIVGGISCAVLGALLGFLTSTFLGVSLRALREAAGEPRRR
jgi:hypothetical protein